MINTLFYFVDDPTFNYQAAVNNGDISEYTIVFNQADRTIRAKNTVFGSMNRADIVSLLGDISDILPVATSSTLGAIKIGYNSTNNERRYPLKLDSNNRAYVEVPWTDTKAPAYDDTVVVDSIDEQRARIDEFIRELVNTVTRCNETLLDDAQWVLDNLVAGQTGRYINENIDEYFKQQYGVWDWVDPSDHSKGKIVKTSVIEQHVDSIDIRVGQVEDYKDGYLTTALNNLEMTVGVDLATGTTKAGTNLVNAVTKLDADTNNIVKMAASVLQLKSSMNGSTLSSTADLASVIVNGAFNGYSGLNTTVTQQGQTISAQGALMSRVVNNDGTPNSSFKADVIAGLATSAYVDDKAATAKTEAIAAAKTNTTNAVAGLASEVYVDNKVATAVASLSAQIDGEGADLTLFVQKDSNGNIESSAKLSADQIYLNGTTWADIIHADQIVTNALSGGNATFTGTVNATSGNFSGDITIRKNNNSPDGLRFDSNGNIQRYDGGEWVDLFAKRHVKYVTSTYTCTNADDLVLAGTNGITINLPQNPKNGQEISVRNIGSDRYCLLYAKSTHRINIGSSDTSHGDNWARLNNDDRATLIYYGGTWYWNCTGT